MINFLKQTALILAVTACLSAIISVLLMFSGKPWYTGFLVGGAVLVVVLVITGVIAGCCWLFVRK